MRKSLYDYCRTNDRPELLKEWDAEKNRPLTSSEVSYGSRKRVWWRCAKGHSWTTAVYTRTEGAGCPFCAGRRPWPDENDLASQYPAIAAQWHPTRNNGLTPADVTCGSRRKVWWRCGYGHEWQATVNSRVSGSGCPICANRILLPGVNDLATAYPALAAQWHPRKNGTLRPEQVMVGNRRKVWWICKNGHEWQASISARASNGSGCPVCAGKRILPGVNDLASACPSLAEQWDKEKNGSLFPEQVAICSNRRVWWRCELGHSYLAAVSARTAGGSGCPYCAGRKVLAGFNDLASREPGIAGQWHPTLNGTLTPEMVTAGSHKKVWWQCPDGHVWRAVIYSRTGPGKCGCPVCTGKVKRRRHETFADVSPTFI